MCENAKAEKAFNLQLEDYLSFEETKNDIIITQV